MTPPSRLAVSNRAIRRLILTASGLTLGVVIFLSLGRLVVASDPLQAADAIYVLAGSRIIRPLEALELYQAGYAPRILMSPGGRGPSELALERRGIHVPTEVEIARDILVTRLDVPAGAIAIPPANVDNTAQEADLVKAPIAANGWTRLIVITDCSSTRRAGYAFRRALGRGVTVIVRCSRNDPFNPNRWWTARWSFRETFYEAPKLLAYWLGLRG